MIARDATLHHVGFVVTSMAESRDGFARSTGSEPVSEIVHDPLQRVRVAFLAHPNGGPQFELVEPFGERSPAAAFAAQGGGLHHLCYEVDDLAGQLAAARLELDYAETPRNGPTRDFLRALVGEIPAGPVVVERRQFASACPPLFHTIEEHTYV